MRGVTYRMILLSICGTISTHTPHARRDSICNWLVLKPYHFYSHASCEAWLYLNSTYTYIITFLLTRLMRGVTFIHYKGICSYRISTHTPHARRDDYRYKPSRVTGISTHTPHAGRHTPPSLYTRENVLISTHTPHARRDLQNTAIKNAVWDFYSHASCEAWLWVTVYSYYVAGFLLTRLMRGVTKQMKLWLIRYLISTHTPHARRDDADPRTTKDLSNFYSHASCEAWLDRDGTVYKKGMISTHTPHARRDMKFHLETCWIRISTHTPHARRDFINWLKSNYYDSFLLTRLMRGVTKL